MEQLQLVSGLRVQSAMGANISPALKQLDRERSLERTLFLNLFDEYNIATRNGDEATVDEKRFLIKKRGARLNELDEKIRGLMLAEGAGNQLLIKEGAECDEFQLKVFQTQDKRKLSTAQPEEFSFPPVNLTPSNWLTFWSNFKIIHENGTMSKTAKFEELQKCLIDDSRARKVVDAYTASDDNYDTVIDQLNFRYGRDQVIIECITRDIVALIQNPVSVRELHQIVSSKVKDLKSLRSYSKEHDWMLVPLVEACLPQYLLGPWRKLKTHNERLVSMLEFLKTNAENENQAPAQRPMMKAASSTGSVNSVGLGPRAPQQCLFCDGRNHKSSKCRNAAKMSYEERVQKIKDKHHCFKCVDGNHHIRFCRRVIPECSNCSLRHLPIMCRGADPPLPPLPAPKNKKKPAKKKVSEASASASAVVPCEGEGAAEEEDPPEWTCQICTYKNSDEEIMCYVCDNPRTVNQEPCYEELLNLVSVGLIPNIYPFDCTICLSTIPRNGGVVLKECLHNFCRECLKQSIELGDSPEIKCPFVSGNSYCEGVLLQQEVRELLSLEMFEQYLARSVSLAESQSKSVHCRLPNCEGWIVYEEDNMELTSFCCPVCKNVSCLKCEAVHENLTCLDYQRQLAERGDNAAALKLTEGALKDLLDSGEAMTCPNCKAIVQKISGCDAITCTKCKTELCWATKGPRWGPRGTGDTSGGCRCGVNGIRCHPTCTYCH